MRRYALILLIIMLVGTIFQLLPQENLQFGCEIIVVALLICKYSCWQKGNQFNNRWSKRMRRTAIIINIPLRLYTVKFSSIGYDTVVFNDV